MLTFLLALLGGFLVSLSTRTMYLMAHLSAALRRAWPLLFCGFVAGALSAAAAAYLGGRGAAAVSPLAAPWLAVAAFLLAGTLLLWRPGGSLPAEPTRSFFAIAGVLAMRQFAGPAGLFLAALAIATGEAAYCAAGGALGCAGAMALCWSRPEWLALSGALRALRGLLAAMLSVAAIWTALAGMGIV